jgi:hypothetical protein
MEEFEKQQEELKKAYIRIFKHNVDGEKILKDLESICGVFSSSYSYGEDSLALAHREGIRKVYLYIHSMLQENPEE